MAADLADSSKSSSEFHHVDALQFLRGTDERFGLIFSSPPYMDTEDYGVESDAVLVEGGDQRLGASGDAVDADAEVEVGAAGVPGVAGEHDRLAGDDLIAEGDGEA